MILTRCFASIFCPVGERLRRRHDDAVALVHAHRSMFPCCDVMHVLPLSRITSYSVPSIPHEARRALVDGAAARPPRTIASYSSSCALCRHPCRRCVGRRMIRADSCGRAGECFDPTTHSSLFCVGSRCAGHLAKSWRSSASRIVPRGAEHAYAGLVEDPPPPCTAIFTRLPPGVAAPSGRSAAMMRSSTPRTARLHMSAMSSSV